MLFRSEQKIRARFDRDTPSCNFRMIASAHQRAELIAAKLVFPALVGLPFIVAFPVDVGLIVESSGEKAEKFSTTSFGAC